MPASPALETRSIPERDDEFVSLESESEIVSSGPERARGVELSTWDRLPNREIADRESDHFSRHQRAGEPVVQSFEIPDHHGSADSSR